MGVYTWHSAQEEDIARGCSILFRLFETSGIADIQLTDDIESTLPSVVPGPVLSRFLTRTVSLEKFTASCCLFCEPHIRALGDASVRPELEVTVLDTDLTDRGRAALLSSMQQNQGPTRLLGSLDTRFLADAIPGTTRLKHLRLSEVDHDGIAVFVPALEEDKGLEELKFDCMPLRDKTWELVCRALPHHPKLHTLQFSRTGYSVALDGPYQYIEEIELPEETKLFRAQQIAELLRTNKVLTSIDLGFQHALIEEEIEPRLVINRFRPKFKAIAKARTARPQLLGRALGAVSDDPTLLFMLLKQNADEVDSHQAHAERGRPRPGGGDGDGGDDNGGDGGGDARKRPRIGTK